MGSSPLTQGKHHDPDHQSAGTVLPRSHGENKQLLVAAASQRGSSPPTRGKLGELVHFLRGHRLIPAHAGKTVVEPVWTNVSTAHPRSRGENAREMTGLTQVQGSSPLTRGKL